MTENSRPLATEGSDRRPDESMNAPSESAAASVGQEAAAVPSADPLAAFSPAGGAALSTAIKESRRYIRLRYFSFVGVLMLLAVGLVVAIAALAVFLLGDGTWQEKAASAAVAIAAFFLIIVMLYRPASAYASAAVELAQLEALQTHLEKSYALWDEFLVTQGKTGNLSANEVTAAVSSMTSATREMVRLQAELLQTRTTPRGAAPARPSFPTPTVPDPRRY